jgi:hypothetical protein
MIAHCGFCNSDKLRSIAQEDRDDLGLTIAYCEECCLVQICPRPPKEWYEAFYRTKYRPWYEPQKTLTARWIHSNYKQQMNFYRYICEFLPETGALIDIGAGCGNLLRVLGKQKPGLRTVGIEPDKELVRFGLFNFGLDLRTTTLSEIDERFDVATMNHVLEHLYDLPSAMSRLNSIIEDNGVVLVEVPDFSGPWNSKSAIHVAHLWYFEATTLVSVFAENGFYPVSIQRFREHPDLPVIRACFAKGHPKFELVSSWANTRIQRGKKQKTLLMRLRNLLYRRLGMRFD